MQLYLNTYSLSEVQPPLTSEQLYDTVANFRNLCQKLLLWNVEVGTEKVRKTLVIGGYPIVDIMKYMTTPKERNLANLVITVYNRYIKALQQPYHNVEFSLDSSVSQHDSGISYSFEKNLPVVSFDYDASYRCEKIKGYVRTENAKGKGKRASVKNLFDVNMMDNNLLALQTFTECSSFAPKVRPMWNQVAMQRYFELINHDEIVKQMITMNDAERIKTLRRYAPMVAMLNGWVEDSKLSRLNSGSHKPRMIFSSLYFASDNYYLSIDFEKPDFVFELIAPKGNHIKEIDWQGNQTGKKKVDHGIKLK